MNRLVRFLKTFTVLIGFAMVEPENEQMYYCLIMYSIK